MGSKPNSLLVCVLCVYCKAAPYSVMLLFLTFIDLNASIFVLCCCRKLYPGEGLHMRRLDGFGLISFSPQLAAK